MSQDILNALREAKRSREHIFTEHANLTARIQAEGTSPGLEERLSNLNAGIARADERIQELEAEHGRAAIAGTTRYDAGIGRRLDEPAVDERYAYLASLARAGFVDRPDEGTASTTAAGRHYAPTNERRDAALRVVERYADRMDDGAADRMDTMIRTDGRRDWVSRYTSAVGDPAYASAFAKLCADPQHGHLRFSPQEVEAVRAASRVQAERAMSIGTDTAGGFLLPFQLDPSVMLTSAGALNPVRRIARVETVSANEWRGVSSAGVTVSYKAEAATMTDDSPVLAQPTVSCHRWDAFVPFSWELQQDDPGLTGELVRLIADGRDVNDSTKFYSGSGTLEPHGITTGLSSTQVVLTAGTASLTASDWWSLKAAIPSRFATQTTFAAPPTRLDTVYRLTPSGGTTEPPLLPTRDGELMGRPVAEWTFNGGTATATGSTVAIAGDFGAGFLVADRLGLTAIPVPVVFGGTAAAHFPTGEAGLAVWGRSGSGVINTSALRLLVAR
jgi:HK97 family phage major capsid protein